MCLVKPRNGVLLTALELLRQETMALDEETQNASTETSNSK